MVVGAFHIVIYKILNSSFFIVIYPPIYTPFHLHPTPTPTTLYFMDLFCPHVLRNERLFLFVIKHGFYVIFYFSFYYLWL